MKLAQFETKHGQFIGIQVGRRWVDYTKAEATYALIKYGVTTEPANTILQLISDGGFDVREARAVVQFVRDQRLEKALVVPKNAVLKAPIQRPPKIVALGLNYVLHAKEGNFEVPKEPIIFMKAGSSVIGPEEPVRIPWGLGRMDHEVELAVVIGKKATGVKKKDAHKYIFGYCIANDVTARDLQTKDLEGRHPWFRSKSFDTFTPLGPWIVTADEIQPPVELDLECRVNGKHRQKSNTKKFVFDIPTQIEFITKYITLEPGDIISTGTPDGIGSIKHGDRIVCRIEKIGELRNPVRNR